MIQLNIKFSFNPIILKNAVESTTKACCTDYSDSFDDLLLHPMGDTPSLTNHQKNPNNQGMSRSRYGSTAFFRIISKLKSWILLLSLYIWVLPSFSEGLSPYSTDE